MKCERCGVEQKGHHYDEDANMSFKFCTEEDCGKVDSTEHPVSSGGGAGTSYYQFGINIKSVYDFIDSNWYNITEGLLLYHTTTLHTAKSKKNQIEKLRLIHDLAQCIRSGRVDESVFFPDDLEHVSLDGLKEVQDFIELHNLNYAVGNIAKVAFTLKTKRHSGTNKKRDLDKVMFFALREISRLKNERSIHMFGLKFSLGAK